MGSFLIYKEIEQLCSGKRFWEKTTHTYLDIAFAQRSFLLQIWTDLSF